MTSAAPGALLLPATRNALAVMLLAIADDEFVIGFSDSEWTGIAPILEEDVAISSLAQDELGHAQAFYRLLAELVDDGRDADAIAFDRPPEGYYHARLLDHPRGDWAQTIARRYLFDTAEDVRMAALERSSYAPLAALVTKVRREERYHLMHMTTWLERLALAEGEPRDRLIQALDRIGAGCRHRPRPAADGDGPGDGRHHGGAAPPSSRPAGGRRSGRPSNALACRCLPPRRDPGGARTGHSEAFRRLHDEFTLGPPDRPDGDLVTAVVGRRPGHGPGRPGRAARPRAAGRLDRRAGDPRPGRVPAGGRTGRAPPDVRRLPGDRAHPVRGRGTSGRGGAGSRGRGGLRLRSALDERPDQPDRAGQAGRGRDRPTVARRAERADQPRRLGPVPVLRLAADEARQRLRPDPLSDDPLVPRLPSAVRGDQDRLAARVRPRLG